MKHLACIAGTFLAATVLAACGGASVLQQSAPVAGGARTVQVRVPANPLWTFTGVSLPKGEAVSIAASGTWCYGSRACNGPDGNPTNFTLWWDEFEVFDLGGHARLVGFIGLNPYQGKWGNARLLPQTSGYISIGSGQTFLASRTGPLWLGINDDAVSKNDGDNYRALHPVIITTGRRDTTGPVIKIKAPTTVYPLNSTTAANYSCSDPDDPVASCAGPVASGKPFNTRRSGPNVFTVVASDGHGNVSSTTVSYTVGGVGVAPLVYPFKPQSVGTASPATAVRLFNRQTTGLNISSISTTGDFHVTAMTCGSVLAAGKNCTMNVHFVPTATGSRQGEVQVQDDAGTQTVILVGVGK